MSKEQLRRAGADPAVIDHTRAVAAVATRDALSLGRHPDLAVVGEDEARGAVLPALQHAPDDALQIMSES